MKTVLKKLKTHLTDAAGTALLLAVLVIYGLPTKIDRFHQKLAAAVCVLLAAVIVTGAGLGTFTVLGAREDKVSEPDSGWSSGSVPVAARPVAFTQMSPRVRNTVFPEGMLEKYRPLYAYNKDVVGWLTMPNTSVDTVVTKRGDNAYYLKTDFYGVFTRYGNVFMDYRNNIQTLSQNTVLYGHTTETKLQVFYDLNKYKDPEFFKANPVIRFDTLYAEYEWKVFAVFISSTAPKDDNGYYFYYIPPAIRDFDGYLNQVKQRMLYTTGVDVTATDNILTLSTCAYENDLPGRKIDSRLVVMARLLRDGEEHDIDPEAVQKRPDWRRPQAWYAYYGRKNPYADSKAWKPY